LQEFRGLTVQCVRWQNRQSAKIKFGQGPLSFSKHVGAKMCTAVVGRTAEAPEQNLARILCCFQAFRSLTVHCGPWQNRRSATATHGDTTAPTRLETESNQSWGGGGQDRVGPGGCCVCGAFNYMGLLLNLLFNLSFSSPSPLTPHPKHVNVGTRWGPGGARWGPSGDQVGTRRRGS